MLKYILLVAGFVCLIKGADFFVEASSSIAKILKVPSLVIGLTVVAFGTSLPEAAVSISAAMKGQNALAMSNVTGSNIFNLLIVLGVSALFMGLTVDDDLLRKDFPASVLMTVLVLVLATGFSLKAFRGGGDYVLGRLQGGIILVCFIAYLVMIVLAALKARNLMEGDEDYKVLSPVKTGVLLVVGIAGIALGGNLVVDSATDIALAFGLSQNFIGLTIVAMGTSLPELVTSIVASRKNENDLAVGNVVGSNIFNLGFVIGSAAVISPVAVDGNACIDLVILVGISVLCMLLSITGKKIEKKEGIIMLITYAVFFAYIYTR